MLSKLFVYYLHVVMMLVFFASDVNDECCERCQFSSNTTVCAEFREGNGECLRSVMCRYPLKSGQVGGREGGREGIKVGTRAGR